MTARDNDVDETHLELRSPHTPDEWGRYFELRWRVLRAPWGQPHGSERDDLETAAFHAAIWDHDGFPVAVGRLHLNAPAEAQVRYMAVAPAADRQGHGRRILAALEAEARRRAVITVVLNARETARAFYERHGYLPSGDAPTLFGDVAHVRMVKPL